MRDAFSPTMQLKVLHCPPETAVLQRAPDCFAALRAHGGIALAPSKLAAAISLAQPLRFLFPRFRPAFAAAAQGAGKIGWALFVECAATLLTVCRHLNQ